MSEKIKLDSELKQWLVNYVGNKLQPEDENITVDMIVTVVANEFPEFLLVVAEENFLRGYEQGLTDNNSIEQKDENNELHQAQS
tara:strand:- start:157 stop:408 length:252 start_codon:yes stop_codon:yes gene_type:complete